MRRTEVQTMGGNIYSNHVSYAYILKADVEENTNNLLVNIQVTNSNARS